jgi:hypothetical protein
MIELHVGDGDSHEFLHVASRLIAGATIASDLPRNFGLWVARVDGFFGQAWLGFRGKLLGQVGFRNRSLKDDLPLPPFHPDRVLSVRYFVRNADHDLVGTSPPFTRSLSCHSSADNVNRRISLKGVYAWYSSGSGETSKGAVMVYVIKDGPNAAWYTLWENKPPWKLTQNVGIATRTCRHFINLGTRRPAI